MSRRQWWTRGAGQTIAVLTLLGLRAADGSAADGTSAHPGRAEAPASSSLPPARVETTGSSETTAAAASTPLELVIFGFEGTLEGWGIPDWAASPDYVATTCRVSQAHVRQDQWALELAADFPGGRWTAAYVEHEVQVRDWSLFGRLSVDVYLPGNAPQGLRGKLILTVGEQWQWTEQNRTVSLTPGEWTTVTVNLLPGSMDWRFFPGEAFRTDIRKLGVRIESDKGPAYRGAVFIDNIRLTEAS
jgi:hypothetical protein